MKFAYDLGLRGFDDEAQTVGPAHRVEFLTGRIIQFVTEASQALRAALPPGRQIAVDVYP
ncbi:hypothetical protein GCM10010412_100430 [Nonomuraea recticatena]|uniref:Uncharacterized protein n=1 Tax=Nonomuraea recticatena TaxID=46178 RepID=A0ABN3TIK3_9ACTN